MCSSLRSACLLLAISAALTSAPAALAAEPQWVEIQSPHFSVVTDAGEKRGREVAIRFEQMRSVFAALMSKGHVNLPIPLQIVAFRNSKEFRQVVPLWHGKPIQAAGLFQPGQDRCFIMLDMSIENPWTTVFHEYAHQLMNGVLSVAVDPWFEEGFAQYFSSIEIEGKQAKVGRVFQYELDILHQDGMMRIDDLFRVRYNSATYNENGDHRTVFYAESDLMVHYLYDNNLVPALITYLDLKINKGLSVEDAIQQSFGMTAQELDKRFRSYVIGEAYRYYPVPTPADIIEKGYSVKPLTQEDSQTVIADVHLHSPDYRDKAIAEFQEILKEDPRNAAACRGLGYAYLQARDFKQAGEYFKRAAQENSEDLRVHYFSALLMYQDSAEHADAAEMRRELETAIALDPSFADAYELLGYANSREGDTGKALANMQKAVSLNPRNENYRFNLAQMYLTNREADEGISILQVLSKSSDPAIAQRAQESLGRAQQFKIALQAARTAAAAPPREAPSSVGDSALEQSVRNQRAAASQNAGVSVLPENAPIEFVKGTVRAVDCSSTPGALITVDGAEKTWTLKVADSKHVLVLGGGAFSCGWKQQKVAINYRVTGESTGTVVSIEVQ